jgi:NAD(P)-dependent dehydrogenase (short-subunit alcohol dehydrogenase family)
MIIKKLMSLNGRWTLITGATGQLGRVIADSLAELGSNLILVDRFEIELEELSASLISRWGVSVLSMPCDLEQADQRLALIKNVKSLDCGLNVLINNAAFVGASNLQGWALPFEQQTVETWRRALEVNLTAVFELCQGFTPILREAEGANIINIASIYGMYGPDWSLYEGTSMSNPAAYGASKGGVIQLSRWLSTTIAPQVRVNSISPGGILRGQPESFIERYQARTPLGRLATEDDFRGAVVYFASDLSQYVTGQNLSVDGGWGAW